MLLLIDNYDSFAHNLARYLERLGQAVLVVRNDAIDLEQVRALRVDAVVLSPGPCTPSEAGCSVELIREFWQQLPILGVCLGHQAIAEALGGLVVRAAEPMHGRASAVFHDGSGVFAGLRSPMAAGRYHSLVVDESTLPADLAVTARAADGTIMALSHRHRPMVGLQFHPESVLTEHGYELLANFLTMAGLPVPDQRPTIAAEIRRSTSPPRLVPSRPVHF